MLEFITRASALAPQNVLPGFLTQAEEIDRRKIRGGPERYAEFIDSPYQIIRGKLQITIVLQQVLDERHPIRLTCRRGVCAADTSLLSIDGARGSILLRELMNEASHGQLLLDGRVNITAHQNDIPRRFTLEFCSAIAVVRLGSTDTGE